MAGERTSDWLWGNQSKGETKGGGADLTAAELVTGRKDGGGSSGKEVTAASLLGFGGGSRGGGGDRVTARDLTLGRGKGEEPKKAGSFFDSLFTKAPDEMGRKPKPVRSKPEPTPREPRVSIRERISKRYTKTDFTPVGDPGAVNQNETGLRGRHSAVENWVRNRNDGGRTISPAIREARAQGRLPDQRAANESPIDEPSSGRWFRRSSAVVTGMAMLRMAAGVDQGSGEADHTVPDASEMAGSPAAVGFAETSNLSLVAEPPRELGALTMTAVHIDMPQHDLAA